MGRDTCVFRSYVQHVKKHSTIFSFFYTFPNVSRRIYRQFRALSAIVHLPKCTEVHLTSSSGTEIFIDNDWVI
jgi:hypothetical protein